MDLSPLYELRDRLKAGAVAGSGLILDDFRLKRAIEAMAPLEAASPIFAKIGQLTRQIYEPACEDRAGALLDALTLADAVLCTQGAVSAPEPLEPLETHSWGSAGSVFTNAPYSIVTPLVTALTNSGGGRYSYVMETHEAHPELFQDYRVKAAMVKALGASYNELANSVKEWLSKDGEALLPLLMDGFDPKGKRDMVRRVQLIESIAGVKANDFFLAQLKTATKDVKPALIYALRHSDENAELLLNIAKTGKGESKKMAHRALAQLSGSDVQNYWVKMAETQMGELSEYLAISTGKLASKLIADLMDTWLSRFEATPRPPLLQADADELQHLLFALNGKSGPAIADCWRRLVALAADQHLDWQNIQDAKQTKIMVLRSNRYESEKYAVPLSALLPKLLARSILTYFTDGLAALADELAGQYGLPYVPPALVAAFLQKPAADVYERAEQLFGLDKPDHKWTKESKDALAQVFDDLMWTEDELRHAFRFYNLDTVVEDMEIVDRPIREPLDNRWYGLLMEKRMDDVLTSLMPKDDPTLCAELGAYFYQRCLDGACANDLQYVRKLAQCGWMKCEGLLMVYCKNKKRIDMYDMRNFIRFMPGTDGEKAEEVARVLAEIDAGNLKLTGADFLRKWLEQLRQDA